MTAPATRGGWLTTPDRMNLGTVLPGETEIVALVDSIRAEAERCAFMLKNEEQRQALLEQFTPLSFGDFCRATGRYDDLLGELADEAEREADEMERQARALEDHDLEQRELDLERRERQQRERALRYEEEQAEYHAERVIAGERQALFEERERFLEEKRRRLDNRFSLYNPKYKPKTPLVGLQSFVDSGLGAVLKPNLEDYKTYLRSINEGFAEAVDSLIRPSEFNEEVRNYNTLVVAPIGWGKSELLKQMIYHYVGHQSAGILVLDPLNDLSQQVRRWPELVNTDRLVLIDPTQDRSLTVGINPFGAEGITDEEDRKELASEWMHILGEITGDTSGNMRRVVNNCIRELLGWNKPASLNDLYLLLGDPEQAPKSSGGKLDKIGTGAKVHPLTHESMRRKGELQAFARNYPDARIQDFFRNEFDTLSVASTRQALRSRLDLLLQIPHAEGMLTGKPTLDLRKVLDEKKVVVVNLSAFGAEENIKAIGCLFLGMVAMIGRKRRETNFGERVPVQVVIDEVTMIVSPVITNMLRQLRKFRIHSTLAQQRGGDNFTYEQRQALLKCTRCKFIAPADKDLPELLEENKAPWKYEPLTKYQFWVKWGDGQDPIRLSVHGHLADTRNAVSDEDFRRHLARGKAAGLYRAPYVAPVFPEEPVDQAPEEVPAGDELPAAPEPGPLPEEVAEVAPIERPVKLAKPAKRATKATKPAPAARKTTAGRPKLFPDPVAE